MDALLHPHSAQDLSFSTSRGSNDDEPLAHGSCLLLLLRTGACGQRYISIIYFWVLRNCISRILPYPAYAWEPRLALVAFLSPSMPQNFWSALGRYFKNTLQRISPKIARSNEMLRTLLCSPGQIVVNLLACHAVPYPCRWVQCPTVLTEGTNGTVRGTESPIQDQYCTSTLLPSHRPLSLSL